MKITGFQDTIDWYDNNAEHYSTNLHKRIPTDSIDWFLSYLSDQPKILEVGCGPGRESKVFVEKGIDTTGIDISKGLLGIAKKNNPSVNYVQGNFLNMSFENGIFDAVFSHASLVHLETINDVKQALNEFYRVLVKQGYLYLAVKLQIGDKETEVVTDSLSGHDRFFRYYTENQLKVLLKQAGFKTLDVIYFDDEHGREGVKWIELVAQKII